jgi:hypothetical protein
MVMGRAQAENAFGLLLPPYSFLQAYHMRMTKHARGKRDRNPTDLTGGSIWCRALFSTLRPMAHTKKTGRYFHTNFMAMYRIAPVRR